jgi:hypothetical protein
MSQTKWGGVLLLMLIVGCGGGETEPVTSEERETSAGHNSPDQRIPANLLLGEEDLPAPSKAEALPEPCSPVPVMESQDAKVAISPLYSLHTRSVAEAVGIAPSSKKAISALEELQSEERMACIRSTMEAFGPQEGVSVAIERPVPLAEGQEGSLIRLLEVDAHEKTVNSVGVASFRRESCVATLLFLLRGGSRGQTFIDTLVRRAHHLLANAHSNC